MTKYITLFISCLTFFVPAFSRAEKAQGEVGVGKIATQRRQQETEEQLFLKLKKIIHPKNFKPDPGNSGMRFTG